MIKMKSVPTTGIVQGKTLHGTQFIRALIHPPQVKYGLPLSKPRVGNPVRVPVRMNLEKRICRHVDFNAFILYFYM
jgi:hypothetical protein